MANINIHRIVRDLKKLGYSHGLLIEKDLINWNHMEERTKDVITNSLDQGYRRLHIAVKLINLWFPALNVLYETNYMDIDLHIDKMLGKKWSPRILLIYF